MSIDTFRLYSGARSVRGRMLKSDWLGVARADPESSLWDDLVRPRGGMWIVDCGANWINALPSLSRKSVLEFTITSFFWIKVWGCVFSCLILAKNLSHFLWVWCLDFLWECKLRSCGCNVGIISENGPHLADFFLSQMKIVLFAIELVIRLSINIIYLWKLCNSIGYGITCQTQFCLLVLFWDWFCGFITLLVIFVKTMYNS